MRIEIQQEGILIVKILRVIPFSSETRRMGIMVEMDGRQVFFYKGAD